MAFIVKKKIHGKDYFYLNENKRVDGKVKTKTLAYLGKDKKEAEKKMKDIIGKVENRTAEEKATGLKRTMPPTKISIDELASFCKRKGFVFPSSEIYGGVSGFLGFGPLGVGLLR